MRREDVHAIVPRVEHGDGVPGSVLHLAGRLTDSVFSFLGPETTALAEQGVRQTLVMIDDPAHRHLLPRFHESVRLVLTDGRAGRRRRLSDLLGAFVDAAAARRPDATHLHGLLPLALGVYASRFRGVAVPALFSPHGSRGLGLLRGLGMPLLRVLSPFAPKGGAARRVVSNSPTEARSLDDVAQRPVQVIESPVPAAYLAARTHESAEPAIASCSQAGDLLGAARLAQIAVLLSGGVAGLRVLWIGVADAEANARLQAAGVTRVDDARDAGDAARADRLGSIWIFVAPSEPHGFPVRVTQAMALGLPCVAWDCPEHRDVIEHGETGLLCRSVDEAIAHIVALVDSRALRGRIGGAARARALERFDADRFRDSVISAYGALAHD